MTSMISEEERKDQVLRELENKLSDDGESTLLLENHLDHLQTLLQQADTEMFGSIGVGTQKELSAEDMAELNGILDDPTSPKSKPTVQPKYRDAPPTPKNILHLSTAENILDVLGFSEDLKKSTTKPEEITVTPEDLPELFLENADFLALATKKVPEKAQEDPSEGKNNTVDTEETVLAPAAEEKVTTELLSDTPAPTNDTPSNEKLEQNNVVLEEPKDDKQEETAVVEPQSPPEPVKEEVVAAKEETADDTPVAPLETPLVPEDAEPAKESMEDDKAKQEEQQQTTQEDLSTEQPRQEATAEEEKKEEDSIQVVVVADDAKPEDEIRESNSVEVVLPTSGETATSVPFDFPEREVEAVASDTFVVRSGQLLRDLKQEVQKLKADYNKVEENNKRLSQANTSAGSSFESLNQHAQQLQKKLEESQEELKESNSALAESRTTVAELRDELSLKQATYGAEVQSRLRYQKALQEVADLVQKSCKDTALVETILGIVDKVEAESLVVPDMNMKVTDETNSMTEESIAGATDNTPTVENKTKKGKEQGGYMAYFKACAWTT